MDEIGVNISMVTTLKDTIDEIKNSAHTSFDEGWSDMISTVNQAWVGASVQTFIDMIEQEKASILELVDQEATQLKSYLDQQVEYIKQKEAELMAGEI